MRKQTISGLLALALSAGVVFGQAAKKTYTEFDIASVKENKATDQASMSFPLGSSDAYTPSGGHFKAADLPLSLYISFAYKIPASQGPALAQQLPTWATATRYDIEAKVEGEPGKDDMRAMMRTLLAQRFGLKLHSTLKEEPVLDLVLVKPGVTGKRLRIHSAEDPHCPQNAAPDASGQAGPTKAKSAKSVEDDLPGICGVVVGMEASAGQMKVGARNLPIAAFASVISGIGNLGRPVVDKTGLPGRYDFALEFTPDAHTFTPGTDFTPDAAGPSVSSALAEQMGLKLVSGKGQVETFVLDRIDRLTAN